MSSAVSALYEPLIARDLEGIGPAIRRFRETADSEDLYLAVARFALLSYAPAQHAKHAVLAVLAAFELRDDYGGRWDELLAECAHYAAASRQPWSEPPMLEPPAVEEGGPADPDELRAAIEAGDRLRGERWLARRLDDPALRRDLVTVSAEDLSDLGHKLIMTNAALKLEPILGARGRFATLRMAVWELTAYHGQPPPARATLDPAALLDRLISRCAAEAGSLESAHAVFLFDAALERDSLDAVSGHLDALAAPASPTEVTLPSPPKEPPVYRLGRDLGAALEAHAVAKRLRRTLPGAPLDTFLAAVHHNLEHGPSLEEWSFA
ncbi:MAG TPA: hypothetical protein VNA04_12780 [Thermoanaerobaculia bacterium]|nr:hypothetical protein [Thermoanaerobaculia bacterium]